MSEIESNFLDLQRILAKLVLHGIDVQLADIYHSGRRLTAIILPGVIVDDGKLMADGKDS